MNNKPKYSIFKNAKYAIDGLSHAFKYETSFKLEIFFSIILTFLIFLLDFTFEERLILFVTLILVMIVELLNSAVENVVDMVTKEFHPLAKSAKDIGATAVLFSLLLHLGVWITLLVRHYY